MKILIFSWRDISNPHAGGSEKYFHELSKEWAIKGNKVTWICGGWKGCRKKEVIDKVNIIRTGKELSLYALAPIEYLKLKEKPDVIIDLENGIPFFTPFFSRKKKFLHIHHIHKDIWHQESEGKGIKEKSIALIGKFLEMKLMPIVYKKTGIITISNSSKEEIEAENIGKVKGIVNPGIDFFNYKKFRKSKTPSVLFLNRIKKYKGVHILLDAAAEINKTGKKTDFWIAGAGDDLERMKKYAKKLRLDNVVFLGRISEEKKKEIMQKAWIFANPSFKEGWGIVNIEANYFGTPVIGSRVGGIKDSVVENKTGLLFEYGNSKELAEKILSLMQNKSLRAQMRKNGTAWAGRFDWASKAQEYLDVLRKA